MFEIIKDTDQFRENLRCQNQQGLVLDIDETLSDTILIWVTEMSTLFGHNGMSIQTIIQEYRYTQNVPWWSNNPKAMAWIEASRKSPEYHEQAELISGADTAVKEINEIVPIVGYITARAEVLEQATVRWLTKHKFPTGQVMFKPEGIAHEDSNDWKAEILTKLYPDVLGIVDDNSGLAEKLPVNYPGKMFWYGGIDSFFTNPAVVACPSWEDVVMNVSKHFGPQGRIAHPPINRG